MQIASSPSPNLLTSLLTNVLPQPLCLHVVPTGTSAVKSSSSSTSGGGGNGVDVGTDEGAGAAAEVVVV